MNIIQGETMFKKMIDTLKGLTRSASPFDPSQLGDPIALQTAWSPAKSGGANFRTHKLVETNRGRMEFRPSIFAYLFYSIFFLIGLGLVIGFSVSQFSSGEFSFKMETVMPMLIGVVFAAVGGAMLYFGTKPIVFDGHKKFFWKGRVNPDHVANRSTIKDFASFKDIHALQLISEYCRGNKSSYYSYELNLVLQNGSRINVVDHGSRSKLRADAEKLASFLGKPVWDAT